MHRFIWTLTGSILGTLTGAAVGFIGGLGTAIGIDVGGRAMEFVVATYSALGLAYVLGVCGGMLGWWFSSRRLELAQR